ncbi:MAG: saccharopine dehydrogenase [Xanthomonadales bacterium]|nr:saccharopine dehydrogenase NADP-binding domain-containing protein [Gammaproteobacteria bacterium]NNK03449.1 saccharopine dehydrogenase [Xanthomonadales bacterium]
MNQSQADFDVIVWGATGFTGRLVAEYLLERYGVGRTLRWAIAGRSQAKLNSLLAEWGQAATDLSILVADAHDPDSLQALVGRTRVMITTVGPYAKYGSELVAACAASGTHYCDLAGEPQWMRKMIDLHGDEAKASGARIVHACGFDSVPFDMAVYCLQQESQRKYGEPCSQVKMRVRAMKGGASGGTVASMMNAIEEARADRDIARILVDPYSLCPPDARQGPDKRDQSGPLMDEDLNVWTAPFIMAGVNTKIVRRSNALMNEAYGPDFSYQEAMATGAGVKGYLKAMQITVALGGLMLAGSIGVLRAGMQKLFLPKPGEGPGPEAREKGFYNFVTMGKTGSGQAIRVKVRGDRDPGYGSTAKILGECGVCLATDELPVAGGFWTPASAMGDALLQRLPASAGLTFSVE